MATVKPNRDCERCKLYETAQTVCLMGRGPVPSDIMAIGEAPGYREDDIGKPFQGDAGVILDEALDAVKLPRTQVYITNAVRCRPPGNKTPLKSQIDACTKWMEKEFRVVKPRFVLLLGRTALKTCPPWNKAKKLGDVLGKTIEHNGVYYLATYHPAACLPGRDKRGRNKATLKAHVAEFARMVKYGGPPPAHELNKKVVRTPELFNEMLSDIQSNDYVSFDLETMSLDQFAPDDHIVLASVGTETTQWVCPIWTEHTHYFHLSPFRTDKARQLAVELIGLALKDCKVITQWGKFDALWFLVKYKVPVKVWLDTGLLAHTLDENRPANLNYLSSYFFNAPNYDISVPEKQGYGISLKRHSTYAAYDVYYTRLLGFRLLEDLEEDGRLKEFFWTIPMPAYRAFRDIEYTGVYLDQKQWLKAHHKCFDEVGRSMQKLKAIAPEIVKWGSPAQLRGLLFERLGLPVLDLTAKGKLPSTSESVLKRLAKMPKIEADKLKITSKVTSKNLNLGSLGEELTWYDGYKQDIPDLIIRYRKAKKQSDFIKSWESHQDTRHRIHPKFKFLTVTGRPSCEEPNLQQVPRDAELRSCFNAPLGWTLVSADYSQIELRLVAIAANEPTMKYIFQTGGDIHTETATKVLGKSEITQEQRKRAKAVNFGFIYGMWWKMFVIYARDNFDVAFTEREARRYREQFFAWLNRLPRWQKRQKRIAHSQGYVRTMAGRRRNLPAIYSHDQKQMQEAERQAINSPIQGMASDMLLASMVEIDKAFSRKILRVCGTIHDEILIIVRNEHLAETLPHIKFIMENTIALKKLGVRFTVPIVAEIKTGPWGKGEKWESST